MATRRQPPGGDRQHLAHEAAHHREQPRNQHHGDQDDVEEGDRHALLTRPLVTTCPTVRAPNRAPAPLPMTCPPPFGRKCLRRATPRKNRRGTRSCRPSRRLPRWLAWNEISAAYIAGPGGVVTRHLAQSTVPCRGALRIQPVLSRHSRIQRGAWVRMHRLRLMGDRSVLRLGGRGRRHPRGIGGERVGALGRRFQRHGPATFPGIRQSARQYRHLALFDRNRDGDGACGCARRQRGRDGEGARPKASRRRDQRGQCGRAGEPQWRAARSPSSCASPTRSC